MNPIVTRDKFKCSQFFGKISARIYRVNKTERDQLEPVRVYSIWYKSRKTLDGNPLSRTGHKLCFCNFYLIKLPKDRSSQGSVGSFLNTPEVEKPNRSDRIQIQTFQGSASKIVFLYCIQLWQVLI